MPKPVTPGPGTPNHPSLRPATAKRAAPVSTTAKPATLKPGTSKRAAPRRATVVFPITEAFGYKFDSDTPAAKDAHTRRACPFSKTPCEEFQQYRYGYCSVTYSAADDERVRYTYAVCDHRLDGAPIEHVLRRHFGSVAVELVPEVVLSNPRTSFDYVAFSRAKHNKHTVDEVIAIETQAIDIRGGGVGPAWRALMDGQAENWRSYFTREAEEKGRKDNVAYGVNMANIYKRLAVQVVSKATYLKSIGIPLYVIMQHRPFLYLKKRIAFVPSGDGEPWDIAFSTFDYTDELLANGQFGFEHVDTVRTTVANYIAALSANRAGMKERSDFLRVVEQKRLSSRQQAPLDELLLPG